MKLNLITLGLILSFPSFAQEQAAASIDEIETIRVTSDYRQLTVGKLPASATVLSAEELQKRQSVHLEDALGAIANLNSTSGASRGRFIQIRGIGDRSQFKEPNVPSVGFLIDDMDFSGTVGVGTVFDVEQVEVLKGPQGTAFGSAWMAGIVKIQTREADGYEDGQVSVSLAQQSTLKINAAYGSKINDKLNFRAAIQQYQSDGYINNVHLGRDDTDNLDELSARLKLRYLVNDSLTFDLALHAFDIDNGYDAFSLDNTRDTLSDQPGFDRQDTIALTGKMEWLLDNVRLRAAISHSDSDIEYGYDEDWTFEGFHPFGYSSVDHYFRDRETTSIDVRLQNNNQLQLADIDVDWVVGIYAKSTNEALLRRYTFADADFTSDYNTDNYALYGEIYSALTDKLTLTTGIRLEEAKLDYADSDLFDEFVSDNLMGGRIVLDYQQSDNVLLYASVNRGYKLGGFNADPRIVNEQKFFKPEFNWNYEAGVKQSFDDGNGFINLALFYMDRKDSHIDDFNTEVIDDTGATSFIDIKGNADVAKNYGIEMESRYKFSDNFEVFLNLGLLDTQFADYVNAKGELVPEREQAQSPNYTFNIGFDYQLSNNWNMRLEADGKDSHYFSDGHNERSKRYTLFNASVTHHWQAFRFDIWGKNLFDRTYYVRGFGGFSNDPRDGYANPQPYYQIADGRSLGVTVTYQF